MKSKFTKLLATALVLCLVLALLPAAAFAEGPYEVKVVNSSGQTPSNGEVVLVGSESGKATSFKAGETVTATPNAFDNCGLFSISCSVEWTKDGASYYFVMPNEVVTITAQFMPRHNITLEGSITGGKVAYQDNALYTERVDISATPDEGFELGYFSVYGNGVDLAFTTTPTVENSAYFIMPDCDVIINAVFKAKATNAITTKVTGGAGTVTTDPANGTYEGDTVTVTAQAAAGATLTEIKVYETADASNELYFTKTSDTTGTFDMPAFPVTVEAVFEAFTPPVTGDYYIIYANNLTGGRIIHDTDKADEDDIVYVYIDPDQLWETDDVYYTLLSSYGLEVYGGELSYAGPAANGYEKWYFRMPASNVAVYATFTPYHGFDYHDITVTNPGSHCTVSVPSGAYCGNDVTINLSNFDTGYAFSYLKVNGEYVTPYGFNGYLSYTFKMPHKDVAIEVGTTSVSGKYYIDTSYDSTLGGVEVWVNNNYVNNWHQGSWANYNDTVSFKVKPYYSDDVVSVSVVGKRTGWTYSCDYNSYSGWYTFTMPNEDVTINVDFRSGVHKVYVDKVTDGKLTVSDDWAKYGQIVYITAVPDYGCTLSSLSVRTATGDSVHVYNAQKADTYYFYMPDQYVSVSAVFTGKYTSLPFNDVSYGDWYYDAVQFVYSKGIMDGVDYYKFAPNGTITRGMILTMLWRMAGEPFEMPVTSFTDVEIGRYYTTAVAWACRNGIADGMGESTFGPNDAITREELVTLLYRYAQYFGHSCIGTSIEGFADAGSVSSYAYNAMCWAYKAGVVTGTTGSRLNPQGTASRAEAAQMIMSFYSFLNS